MNRVTSERVMKVDTSDLVMPKNDVEAGHSPAFCLSPPLRSAKNIHINWAKDDPTTFQVYDL